MTNGYKVIGNPKSRAMRVLWVLEELGLDYDFSPDPPHSDAVRALNPEGKVPVFLMDGEPFTDSVAIIQYLADTHGSLTFPAGTRERLRQDGFTQFAVEEVDGALWTRSKHAFVYPPEKRLAEIKPLAIWEFDRAMKTLEHRLGDREFVMGDRFTIPDIILGHCGGWAVPAGFNLPDGPVGDYLARVRSRPALRRAMKRAV